MDEIPDYVESWEGLRLALWQLGLEYSSFYTVRTAWIKYGVPYAKGTRVTFNRQGIKDFIRHVTGVTSARWIAQRNDDLSEGRIPSSPPSLRKRKDGGFNVPIWIATTLKKMRPWIYRDGNYSYVTLNRMEAESWDVSGHPGNIKLWKLRSCIADRPHNVYNVRRLHPRLKRRKWFSVWAAIGMLPDGVGILEVGGALVGENVSKAKAAITAAVPRREAERLVNYVQGRRGVPVQWYRFYGSVEVEPVTLDRIYDEPENADLVSRDVIEGALTEYEEPE